MLKGRFPASEFAPELQAVATKLTAATIELWRRVKGKMLPTPAKFHYVFNMREMSRTFQGILLTPKDTIKSGGIVQPCGDQGLTLLRLWRHECARVFMDKLTTNVDKKWYEGTMEEVIEGYFGGSTAGAVREEYFFVDFFREDVYDDDEVLQELAPKIYEAGGPLQNVRDRVKSFMAKHNEENPSRKLELVLFEDALRHLIRISRIIEMPRGSALLVGVGGSGKQSLTRLAAYIARHRLFQITLTKTYNMNALKEDLKSVYDTAGHLRRWAVPSLAPAGQLRGHSGAIKHIAVHPSQPYVATASLDRTCLVFHADTRQLLRRLYLKQRLAAVLFAPGAAAAQGSRGTAASDGLAGPPD
jgi:dynein heavy chain